MLAIEDPILYLAFTRGKFRKQLLMYLYNNCTDSGKYLSQIAKCMRADRTQVHGCMIGNTKYSKDYSLLELDLVDCTILKKNVKVYTINEKGINFVKKYFISDKNGDV